jgi:hypothetical protein
MRIGTFVLVLTLALGAPGTVPAEDGKAIAERLARATTLRCRIDPGTSTVWKGDRTTQQPPTPWGEHASFHVDALNVSRGTARIIGGISGNDAQVLRFDAFGLHLIEYTGLGVVFYSVFVAETKDLSALPGVMSRHLGRLGDAGPVVSQWPLRCEILP